MRDALRYKRKKIVGKSGDSGGETPMDETNTSKDGSESMDYLSFLTPTSSRFPRKTIVMGAETEGTSVALVQPSDLLEDTIRHDRETNPFCEDADDSSASVYSFASVSILFTLSFFFYFILFTSPFNTFIQFIYKYSFFFNFHSGIEEKEGT